MRFIITTLLLLAVAGGPALGQEEEQSSSQSTFEALNSAWQRHQQEFFEKQREDGRKARAAARKAREEGKAPSPMRAMSMRAPLGKHLAAFQAAAKERVGTEEAIPFLIWVAEHALGTKHKAAVGNATGALIGSHIKSEGIGRLPSLLAAMRRSLGDHKVNALLVRLENENPHASVRAQAIMARITPDLKKAPVESKKYIAAKVDALRAIAMNDGRTTSALQGMIDLREKLVVGMAAPEISGVDLDGTAFKLSDYKGKIILLDFWGDW